MKDMNDLKRRLGFKTPGDEITDDDAPRVRRRIPKPPKLVFTIRRDGYAKRVVTLQQRVIKIGKLSGAHLRLEGDGVSRMHAYIKAAGGEVILTDLGSAHGTMVNDNTVGMAQLKDGDRLYFGEVEVTINIEDQGDALDGFDPPEDLTFEDEGDFHVATAKKMWKSSPPHRCCPKCEAEVVVTEEKRERKPEDVVPVSILMVHHHNDICDFDGPLGQWLEWVRGYNRASGKVYYCEQCFHTHGNIVEMYEAITNEEERVTRCPTCHGEWKLNRGQARHVVSLKLQHYRKLAQELGILEIEEEHDPV